MMSAPLSVAQVMPLAMSASTPVPSAPSTLTGMTLAFHATPATPPPLPVAAPTTPATAVPWPSSSLGSVSPLTMSRPATRFGARSGWSRSTPVSSTATTVAAPVSATSHAVGAPIRLR
jgi:hypothetical protein